MVEIQSTGLFHLHVIMTAGSFVSQMDKWHVLRIWQIYQLCPQTEHLLPRIIFQWWKLVLTYHVLNTLFNSQCETRESHFNYELACCWKVGLKGILRQTWQAAGAERNILIDTVVAFNQLRKNESSLLCMKASRCQQNSNWAVKEGKQPPFKTTF